MMKHATSRTGLAALLFACGTGAAIADGSHASGGAGAPDGKNDVNVVQNDSSYEKYRCVVLGADSACRPQKVSANRYRLAPGSYAAYLMENGMDQTQALAAARAIGEEPTWLLTKVEPPQQLSSYKVYAREMGLSVPSQPKPSTALGQSK
jgi:hypothetical protein